MEPFLRGTPNASKFDQLVHKRQIYDLATCRFIREAKDVLWLGPPGVGKSFLVKALGYQAIKCGFLVYYRSVFDVVRDFLQDEAFGGHDKGKMETLGLNGKILL